MNPKEGVVKPSLRSYRIFAAAILLGYIATLATSAGHLAEWYMLSRGSLHPALPYALSITLEANAFILSLLSNYTLRHSRWALTGSLIALGLVWLGNYMSMLRAAKDLMMWEVFAASMFVPVGTYIMGKALGEILTAIASLEQEDRKPQNTAQTAAQESNPPHITALYPPTEIETARLAANGDITVRMDVPTGNGGIEYDILNALTVPRTTNEVYSRFPGKRQEISDTLRKLADQGIIAFIDGRWQKHGKSHTT